MVNNAAVNGVIWDSDAFVKAFEAAGGWKIENESAKAALNNVESITEEKIDELLNKFMKDFKEGLLEEEGWQPYLSAYTVSKAALNAYTRMLDNKYSNMLINCVSAQAMSKLT
ncbi:hypothetical protein ACOSP7_001054 [Xanthoceras sorbifolium]